MQTLSSLNPQSWLSWFLKGLLAVGLVVLVARLAELQIIKGNYYHALAEENRIRRVSITAPRGEILARGGEKLVGNSKVQKLIEFDQSLGFVKKQADQNSQSEDLITEWNRMYFLGSGLAHVTGYLGQVDQTQIGRVDPKCTDKGPIPADALVGRSGLEMQYSCRLKGINGEKLLEVDTQGSKIRILGTRDPVPGENITTTIDYGLQQKIVDIFDDIGAVVATDGKGEVLALYSSPSFDPTRVDQYINDKSLPLFDRAISGAYHPASTFKLAVSIGALEEGKIDSSFGYLDTGEIKVNEFSYTNWYFTQYGGVEGLIDLPRAIARSTDTFFYKVGEMLGPNSIANWAGIFGFGKKTNIDLPGEVTGLVPTPAWKLETKAENWFLGNTYHMAIGQGDVTATPLQANVMTAAIATNGQICQPHLVNDFDQDYCKQLDISQESLDLVKQGMIDACSEGGTGYPFFDFTPPVACKTGTAETFDESKTHAWFTVYAPAQDPQIVVTVLVENGGEGSQVAAPIARQILDYWFYER